MKKTSFLLSICFLLLLGMSCQQGTKHEDADHVHESEPATASDTALALNNGAKWQTDSTTSGNVVELHNLANNFQVKPFPSTSDYQLVANDLKSRIDTLMKQCTMKGDAHNELHKWLEPVIHEVNDLKNTSDTASGRQLFSSIRARIDNYGNYFQYGY